MTRDIWNFDGPETEVFEDVELETEVTEGYRIILFNDDVNTFDYVIDSLVEVCDHDPIQAEQCAYLVHYKGKCDVKNGEYEELKPMCSELLRRGLSAEIKSYSSQT